MTKPVCKLSGTDGNVFALAGRVGMALRRAGQMKEREEFHRRLALCGSYAEALGLMGEYVEVR